MIGNRKAFKQAAIAYLCIGAMLCVGIAFHGAKWDGWIILGWILAVTGIWMVGSLLAIRLTWKQAKKGEAPGPIYPHDLLPNKIKKWMTGENGTGTDR